jgi:hypothetical protein
MLFTDRFEVDGLLQLVVQLQPMVVQSFTVDLLEGVCSSPGYVPSASDSVSYCDSDIALTWPAKPVLRLATSPWLAEVVENVSFATNIACYTVLLMPPR